MVFEKSMVYFGIYEWIFSTNPYRDSIYNREYHYFCYGDGKIFSPNCKYKLFLKVFGKLE